MPSTLSGWAAMTSRKVPVAASRSPSPSSPPAPGRTSGPASAGSPARRPAAADGRRPRGSPRGPWPSAASAREAIRIGLGARLLDEGELLLVGGAAPRRGWRGPVQLVGADAAGDAAADRLGLGGGAADQLGRARPVQAHAALGGVHRLGDAESVGPQVTAEGEGGVPVDGGGRVGRRVAQRVGDDVGGRVDRREASGAPVARATGSRARLVGRAGRRLRRAVGWSQRELRDVEPAALGGGLQARVRRAGRRGRRPAGPSGRGRRRRRAAGTAPTGP